MEHNIEALAGMKLYRYYYSEHKRTTESFNLKFYSQKKTTQIQMQTTNSPCTCCC